ncbi:sugar ABC transporter permease [Actinoplanes sp. NBRC 103695]|uniref:carbohydrate ABC transporter permease n=1 Tax=Actinoplanes sp. NBRC 103695 TaxID=3032202 RepID=UPI0024A4E5E4|nr:sugar ABC transporter permease [Actinoplanes sp. NBRC 103695]GLZ00989.1 sugar ABC transporter permease [Actinoplanes sp. NBRC 103695]
MTRARPVGVLLSLPAVTLVALLLVLPIAQTAYYSLTAWDGFQATWAGLGNYAQLFNNPAFGRVLENNLLLLLSVPVAVIIPFGIAAVLNEHVLGWRLFRALYFLPTAVSWVVTGMVATRFFAQDGILNGLLRGVGLGFVRTDLLAGERTALLAVGLTFVWSMVGTNTLIFSAGLATVDPSLLEAARCDGAGPVRAFFSITLPQLARFLQFAVVLTTISAFTALFSLIFVMTSGGPGDGTTTMEFYIYQRAFTQGEFGQGAMLGMVLLATVGLVTLIQVGALARVGRES